MATILNKDNSTWTGNERRVTKTNNIDASLMQVGLTIARYGLATIFIWVGILKFSLYEAKNIEPMVSHSPIFALAYQMMGINNLSSLLGVIEIIIGTMIALRMIAPRLSALGGIGATISFLITLSFMFTTPGVWEPNYGPYALSSLPGQFLAKDLVLLGVSIWITGEALNAIRFKKSPKLM